MGSVPGALCPARSRCNALAIFAARALATSAVGRFELLVDRLDEQREPSGEVRIGEREEAVHR